MWSEALLVYVAGTVAGLAIGWLLAWMLTKLMTQVFDPPPDVMVIPWSYITVLCLTGLVAICIAVIFQLRKTNVSLSTAMRAIQELGFGRPKLITW